MIGDFKSELCPTEFCKQCGKEGSSEDIEEILMNYKSKWIPCEERLPEKDGHYLCTVTKPQYIDGIYVKFIYWCGRWYGWQPSDVTAWMPLPEPYKGE
jgi:hypothetical protein